MQADKDLKLYKVLPKYISALRDESNGGDISVYMVNAGKDDRPFIGIVTLCNSRNYFIPLTSYKERFRYLTAKEPDFTPIYKSGKMIAAIEFNKMIPVPLNQIRPLDLESHKHDNKSLLIKKALRKYECNWCNQHKDEIQLKAQKLYDMVINHDASYKNINYCVNFSDLERICDQYECLHSPQHHDYLNDN